MGGRDDEFHTHHGDAEKHDNDSHLQYNFLEKKEQTLYKSMQKSLKSDKDIDGLKFQMHDIRWGPDGNFHNQNDLAALDGAKNRSQ